MDDRRKRRDARRRKKEQQAKGCLGLVILMAILTLGMPASHPAPHTVEELPLAKIHREHF